MLEYVHWKSAKKHTNNVENKLARKFIEMLYVNVFK